MEEILKKVIVIDTNVDQKNGRLDTHKKCREELNKIIHNNDLTDIWRLLNQNKLQYRWHSNTKPTIFRTLDFFPCIRYFDKYCK